MKSSPQRTSNKCNYLKKQVRGGAYRKKKGTEKKNVIMFLLARDLLGTFIALFPGEFSKRKKKMITFAFFHTIFLVE